MTLRRLPWWLPVMLLLGCQSQPSTEDMLTSAAGPERMRATVQLSRKRDWNDIPVFIGLLSDQDVSVRLAAAGALKDRTGRDFGFRAYGPEPERAEAVRRWEQWWDSEGKTGPSARGTR